MKISSKYKFCDVQQPHFEQMATLIGMKPSQVILRFKKLAKTTLLESRKLISELNANDKFKNGIYNEIALLIQNQAKIVI